MDTKNEANLRAETGFINYIPSIISSLRIIFAPVLFYTFLNDLNLISLILFLCLSSTDVLDGYIARKYEVSSNKGAYLDVVSDFILLLTVFTAFVITGIYPQWILILIIFMFLQFVLSSSLKMPVYDPLGKYLGTVLFGGAFITLTFYNLELYAVITLFILIFAVISLLTRYLFLFLRWRKSKRYD